MKSLGEERLFSLSLSRLRRYPTATFSYPVGDWRKGGTKLFSEVLSGNRLRCSKGNYGSLAMEEKILCKEWCSIRTWAQRGDGMSILGNTQSSAGHGPEQPALYLKSATL